MLLHILAVGDVVSERGLDCLHHHLRALKKEHDIHFTVVNGENAAGLGLLPRPAGERPRRPPALEGAAIPEGRPDPCAQLDSARWCFTCCWPPFWAGWATCW